MTQEFHNVDDIFLTRQGRRRWARVPLQRHLGRRLTRDRVVFEPRNRGLCSTLQLFCIGSRTVQILQPRRRTIPETRLEIGLGSRSIRCRLYLDRVPSGYHSSSLLIDQLQCPINTRIKHLHQVFCRHK